MDVYKAGHGLLRAQKDVLGIILTPRPIGPADGTRFRGPVIIELHNTSHLHDASQRKSNNPSLLANSDPGT